eukprot:914018_1
MDLYLDFNPPSSITINTPRSTLYQIPKTKERNKSRMKPVQSLSLAACLVTLASAHRRDSKFPSLDSLDSLEVESKRVDKKLARLFKLADVLEQGEKEVADKLTETEFEADSRSPRHSKQKKLRKLRRAKSELEKVEEEVAEEVAQTVLVEEGESESSDSTDVKKAVLKAKKDGKKTKKDLKHLEEAVKRTEEAIANEDVSGVLVGVAKAEEAVIEAEADLEETVDDLKPIRRRRNRRSSRNRK